MKGKKFWRKAFNVCLITGIFFFTLPQIAQASKSFGIVGLESRVKDTNLENYTNMEGMTRPPLIYAADIFEEIATTEFMLHGLNAVDRTDYAKRVRDDEAEFQRVQEVLRGAISALEKGDTSPSVKIFAEQPDYLIYGYIANLTVTHRESIATSNFMVRVLLTARVVDAKTGKIISVATGEGVSSNRGGAYRKAYKLGGSSISEDGWHEAIDKATNQILDKLKKRI